MSVRFHLWGGAGLYHRRLWHGFFPFLTFCLHTNFQWNFFIYQYNLMATTDCMCRPSIVIIHVDKKSSKRVFNPCHKRLWFALPGTVTWSFKNKGKFKKNFEQTATLQYSKDPNYWTVWNRKDIRFKVWFPSSYI